MKQSQIIYVKKGPWLAFIKKEILHQVLQLALKDDPHDISNTNISGDMNVFYYTQLTDLMKIKFEKKSNVIYTIALYCSFLWDQ